MAGTAGRRRPVRWGDAGLSGRSRSARRANLGPIAEIEKRVTRVDLHVVDARHILACAIRQNPALDPCHVVEPPERWKNGQ